MTTAHHIIAAVARIAADRQEAERHIARRIAQGAYSPAAAAKARTFISEYEEESK